MLKLKIKYAVFAAAAAAFTIFAITSARTQTDMNKLEEEIWAKEFAIFEGRGQGDLSNYLDVTSEAYIGWPPVMKEPLSLENFKADRSGEGALKGEVITLEKKGFTATETTAIAYFSTHRTRLGEGFAEEGERDVDQRYENIHVWTKEDGEWRLVGGMARLVPEGPRLTPSPEGSRQE